jgi:hypothetical protein
MRFTELVTPIATTHWNDRQLCGNNSTANRRRHLFRTFNAETDMSVVIADCNKCLETCTLTGARLLLHRHDLEHFVFQRALQEHVNNFKLL